MNRATPLMMYFTGVLSMASQEGGHCHPHLQRKKQTPSAGPEPVSHPRRPGPDVTFSHQQAGHLIRWFVQRGCWLTPRVAFLRPSGGIGGHPPRSRGEREFLPRRPLGMKGFRKDGWGCGGACAELRVGIRRQAQRKGPQRPAWEREGLGHRGSCSAFSRKAEEPVPDVPGLLPGETQMHVLECSEQQVFKSKMDKQ